MTLIECDEFVLDMQQHPARPQKRYYGSFHYQGSLADKASREIQWKAITKFLELDTINLEQ